MARYVHATKHTEFTSGLRGVVESINNASEKRMQAAGHRVRTHVMYQLSGTRTGRMYRKPGTNVMYRASAPGEPPARPTGDLARSYRLVTTKDTATIGSPLPKAPHLELGTEHMEPRPHLEPAFRKAMREVELILARRWF